MNFKMILYVLGMVLNLEAVFMLLPLICAILYNETTAMSYLVSMACCLLPGLILVAKAPEKKSMYAKEGFIIVALSWIAMSAFGALPFVISGGIPNYIDAFFETVSGFTTTGASILSDVEALPKSLLFWRSFTHWLGGMGVLVFLVALLPLCGGNNMHLIKAESTGADVNKLVSRVGSSAKILYLIYIGLTVLQVIMLLLGGLNLFESLTLTFGSVGTGGFSIVNSGAADYSPYVQWTITVFMTLCGVDFSVYYLLIMRKFKDVLKAEEVRAYILVFLVATGLITINILPAFDGSFTEALRHGAFQVSSIMTTTGYTTRNYELWPAFSKTVLVLLMFIGACAGSTGGGIKVSRILLLFKSIVKEIKIAVHPRRTYKVTLSGRTVEHETVRAINVFMAAYLFIFGLSLIMISLDNMDFTTNFTAVAATINNIGPGLGGVGPVSNFGGFSAFSKLVLCFDMLAGRLEIFPMLVLFSAHTWKK